MICPDNFANATKTDDNKNNKVGYFSLVSQSAGVVLVFISMKIVCDAKVFVHNEYCGTKHTYFLSESLSNGYSLP